LGGRASPREYTRIAADGKSARVAAGILMSFLIAAAKKLCNKLFAGDKYHSMPIAPGDIDLRGYGTYRKMTTELWSYNNSANAEAGALAASYNPIVYMCITP
jgi:hypothetical protein